MNSKYNVCTSHGFNYDNLEEAIITTIRRLAVEFLNKIELERQSEKLKFENPTEKIKNDLHKLQTKYENTLQNLDKIYIDKIEEKITEEMYNRVYQKMKIEIDNMKIEIDDLQNKLNNNEETNIEKFNCKKYLEEFISMKNITRDMMLKLIDKIYLHADKQIDIHFNFNELN